MGSCPARPSPAGLRGGPPCPRPPEQSCLPRSAGSGQADRESGPSPSEDAGRGDGQPRYLDTAPCATATRPRGPIALPGPRPHLCPGHVLTETLGRAVRPGQGTHTRQHTSQKPRCAVWGQGPAPFLPGWTPMSTSGDSHGGGLTHGGWCGDLNTALGAGFAGVLKGGPP